MGLKLNQVIALVGGRKTAIQKLLTSIHHGWKAERVTGMTRTYQPKHEDGERFPSENKPLQLRVRDEIETLQGELAGFWDLVATQEASNQEARANIIIDGVTVAGGIPVTTLLFLEKQLTDLATLASNLPTLPIDRAWKPDGHNRCWVTEPEQTIKTRKDQKAIVLYDATKEHPAQTQLISVDVTIGTWDTVHISGAIPADEQHAILHRIEKLRDAVKVAREHANGIDAVDTKFSTSLLSYIFSDK